MRAAVTGKPSRRGHQQHRPAQRHATEKSRDKTESGGHVVSSLGCSLVQGSKGKATLWKAGIERGHTKRKGPSRKALQPRQQAA